jgi:hypothetical protein
MARDGWRTRLTPTALVSVTHGRPQLMGRDRKLRQRYVQRDIWEDNCVRADGDIIANRNWVKQLSPGSNVDMVPDG